MKITEFRKLIKEEVRKVIKEVDMGQQANSYFVQYFDGQTYIDGEHINSMKDLFTEFDSSEFANVGPVSKVLVEGYTAYVFENMASKQNSRERAKGYFCIITPYKSKIENDESYGYGIGMKAIKAAQAGKSVQTMAFDELLKMR